MRLPPSLCRTFSKLPNHSPSPLPSLCIAAFSCALLFRPLSLPLAVPPTPPHPHYCPSPSLHSPLHALTPTGHAGGGAAEMKVDELSCSIAATHAPNQAVARTAETGQRGAVCRKAPGPSACWRHWRAPVQSHAAIANIPASMRASPPTISPSLPHPHNNPRVLAVMRPLPKVARLSAAVAGP